MTMLPSDSWNVNGAEGPEYKVGPGCCNPDCTRFADHAHHLWRRSFIGGDVAWAQLAFLEPPITVQNKVGLCAACHDDITTNKAWIAWVDNGTFAWMIPAPYAQSGFPDWKSLGPITPQPARLGAAADNPVPDHGDHGSAEVCPTCKRPKRKRDELPPGEKRKRKTWAVKVPDDNEDGADVLDTLVDVVAERWGMGEYTSQLRRYYVLVPALAAVIQHNIEMEGT